MTDRQNDLIQAPREQLVVAEKYQVELPQWKGPYDLLLQVIEDQGLNLLDLDIAKLLDGYMAMLESATDLNLDEAGDFLVVAATLAQIKSRLLLPQEPVAEEEEKDPREDLVKYLIEYQKMKQAAELLKDRPLLGRDVFTKGVHEHFEGVEAEGHGNLFQLVKGFQKVLRELKAETPYQIEREDVSVSVRFQEIFSQAKDEQECSFEDLLKEGRSVVYVIATFLAILELVRLKKISILQRGSGSELFLKFIPGASDTDLLKSEFDEETALPAEEIGGAEGVQNA
jgi:segregation and condensation protein A